MAKKLNLIEKAKVLVQISRPLNILMVVFGAVVTTLAALGKLAPFNVLIPVILTAAFIATAGNAINDYYDIGIDRINRPERALPSGKITAKGLWAYAIVLFALGILSSMFLDFYCIVLAVANTILLGVYAYKLKKSGFFGDLLISYLVASVFIFSALAINTIKIGLILAIAAFSTNTAREILKDLEDVKGDKLFGARTLPVIWGKKKSIAIVTAFLILSILVSPLPYLLGILSSFYMIFALFADVIFAFTIYSLFQNSDLKSVKANQFKIKLGAIIGLLAFLAGIVRF